MEEQKTRMERFKQWTSEHVDHIMVGVGFVAVVVGTIALNEMLKNRDNDLEDTFEQIGRDIGGLRNRLDAADFTLAELTK